MPDEAVGSAVLEQPVVVTEGAPQTETVAGESVTEEGGESTPQPLDPAYVARAQSLSLTEDELRVLPRETVERMIASADRMLIDHARREYPQEPAQPAMPRRENGQFAPAAAPAPSEFAYEPWKPELDPDADETAPMVKNFTGIEAHIAKQFDRLHKYYESRIKAHDDFRSESIVQQNNARVDRFVESQGPDWQAVFGKGPTAGMNPQSQEFLNRVEVWTAANAMVRRSGGNGRAMTLDEALPRARNAVFMEKAFAIERAKADAKRKELAGSASVRPKSGGSTSPNGGIRQRAQQMAQQMRR